MCSKNLRRSVDAVARKARASRSSDAVGSSVPILHCLAYKRRSAAAAARSAFCQAVKWEGESRMMHLTSKCTDKTDGADSAAQGTKESRSGRVGDSIRTFSPAHESGQVVTARFHM